MTTAKKVISKPPVIDVVDKSNPILNEFISTVKLTENREDVSYEVGVIISDAMKKINNCLKDHGYT